MRDGLCWRHPAAEAGNSAQHATESSGLSVGDVHTRVGGQARTVSVQCAHFRDVPRQRFGSSEGQDIDLYIGPEPTACLLLHSRIAFGHSPILESRLSGTIDEGLDQKKYSAVLVVDARGFFQIQPLKNINIREINKHYDFAGTSRSMSTFTLILEVWYKGRIMVAENVLEATKHC